MGKPSEDDEETTVLGKPAEVEEPAGGPSAGSTLYSGRIQGYLHNRSAFDLQHDGNMEDVFDIRSKFGLALEVTSPEMVKAYVAARFSHFVVGEDAGDEDWLLYNSRNVKSEFDPELREAYIYIPWDVVNVRAGNQIVRWGFAQFNKPADVLNPSDLREGLFSDLEVPLLPAFMLHLDRTFGPANVSAVWIPFFTPNRANLFGQDWAPLSAMSGNPAFASLSGVNQVLAGISSFLDPLIEDRSQPIMLATRPPEENLENGQWGGKVEFNFDSVDLFASYFYGWDKLPVVYMNPQFGAAMSTMMADEPDLLAVWGAMSPLLVDEDDKMRKLSLNDLFSTSYRRQQTVGAGVSTILFGRVGFKADAAFSPSRTLYLEPAAPTEPPAEGQSTQASPFPIAASKPAFSYSAGIDYARSTWLNLGLEFYHFHVLDLAPGESAFLIDSDLYMVTALAALRLLDFDQLELQLAGMVELDSRSVFLFPKVAYKFTDNLRAALGAQIVEVAPGGRDMSPGGLFDRNDAAYAEVKWSF